MKRVLKTIAAIILAVIIAIACIWQGEIRTIAGIRSVSDDDPYLYIADYCFNVKGFSVLWGDCFPKKPASCRVMEKCGFVDTGKEVLCPGLEIGGDKPVRVMRLDYLNSF